MKQRFTLMTALLLAVLLLCTACGSGQDSVDLTQADLSGTYYFKAAIADGFDCTDELLSYYPDGDPYVVSIDGDIGMLFDCGSIVSFNIDRENSLFVSNIDGSSIPFGISGDRLELRSGFYVIVLEKR